MHLISQQTLNLPIAFQEHKRLDQMNARYAMKQLLIVFYTCVAICVSVTR